MAHDQRLGLRFAAAIWFVAGFGCCMGCAAETPDENSPTVLASIRVQNPTAWEGPIPIEVPAGRLAAPGIIDWAHVRLLAEDGSGMLTRNDEKLAPMGDTWLDNVFSGFRVPTAARMKRLLADRNSFWIGGALRESFPRRLGSNFWP